MKQVFLGLGLILGAAGAVASGFQQPIEISPARPVLAEGKLQLLSEGLMVPLVHALVQSNSAPVVVRRADGLGVVDAWSWSPDLQLAWNHGPGSAAGEPAAPQSSAARQTTTPPKPLPENRWAWSRVCSLLIDVPSERVPPALDQLHAAVLTASGELWPARVLGLEPFESQWVVRIQEEDRFVGEDPARTILLRIEREADSAIDAQFWSVQELRACVSKPWVEQKTGTVEVHAEQGMPFGDRIGAQTLSALQLIPESPFPALTHTAALGWLACPDPSHRTFLSSRVARIRGVPVGSIQILATLTGSTTVAQTTTVEPGKTRVVELFETQVLGGTSVLNPPSSEQPWEVVRDWPRGVQFVSWVWGPLGNLYSAQGWEVLDPEAPETNPLEAPALPSWRVPSDGVFGWQRLVVGDDGSAVHSWQTFPAEAQQAPFWTQFGAQGRKPSARLLELTEQPSTVWSGTLVLFLFQGQVAMGQTQVQFEAFTLSWPEDRGRKLKTRLDLEAPWFWYAVSWEGQGAFGTMQDLVADRAGKVAILDPSMQPGWSSLLVTRAAPLPFRQAAGVRSLAVEGGVDLDSTWQAAGGLTLDAPPFPPIEPLGGQMGVCLLRSPGIPQSLHFQIPGALDRTIPTPDATALWDVQIAPQR